VIGSTVNYTVRVEDGHGNPKTGQQVNWVVTSGGGSITPPSNATIANGQASADRNLSDTEGPHTAIAVAPNNVTLNGVSAPDTVTFTTTATPLPAAATVAVNDNFFSPDSVRIAVNGTVTWDWGSGGVVHNVTFAGVAGAPANIPDRNTGTVSRTFAAAGTFNYQCTIHPGMNGKVLAQ